MASKVDDEVIKNKIHDDKDFQENSKIQAATDAKHDIGTQFTTIYNTIPQIGTPQDNFPAPLKGTGWDVVKTILETDVDIPTDTIPAPTDLFTEHKYKDLIEIKYTKFKYNLTTMNIEYNDEKRTENADKLFNFLRGSDESITEVCLIVDATTGDFQKILLARPVNPSTKSEGEKKKIYYIVNRETISDPAGKPNESDSNFKEKANRERDVQIKIAVDVSEDKVLYPKWGTQAQRLDFHNDFFSNFDIELTPVKYGESKSVMLTFSGKDYSDTSVIETSAAGKLTNSINAVKKILTKMYNNITKFTTKVKGKAKADTVDDNNAINDYFVTLQKKRSGDALTALSYFDTSRIYNSEGTNFTFKEKKRFVLSHDTFNTLPVSLANGAEIIYTGAKTIYKFERADKGNIDFTKAFFDAYLSENKVGERNKIKVMFSKQKEKYFGVVDAAFDIKKDTENYGLKTIKEKIKKTLKTLKEYSLAKATLSSIDTNDIKSKIPFCIQCFFELALFRSLYLPLFNINKINEDITSFFNIIEYNERLHKTKVDQIKDLYYTQKIKDGEYNSGFENFRVSYKRNIVYTQIGEISIFTEPNKFTFSKTRSKLTFGTSSVIHDFLKGEDGTSEFIDIIDTIYKNENILGKRAQKNKAPMTEILSAFIDLQPLLKANESSVKTSDLLVAAHEEIGLPLTGDQELEEQRVDAGEAGETEVAAATEVAAETAEGEEEAGEEGKKKRKKANTKLVDALSLQAETGPQPVASLSCILPYHSGISKRVIERVNNLVSSITSLFKKEKFIKIRKEEGKDEAEAETAAEANAAQKGGASAEENSKNELYSFILLNYMFEMNVYFEGEYNDPDLDIYGQNIPMAGKLLLYMMNTSVNPISFLLFFMKMSYEGQNNREFEKTYNETLKGNKYLFFLPCIFENILCNAFGPKFVEKFQEISLTYFPKLETVPELNTLLLEIPEMTNPKWEDVKNEMHKKIRKISVSLENKPVKKSVIESAKGFFRPRLANQIAVRGGYKKTKKLGNYRNKTRRSRYKK
jgi:hypothetical protein